jgi:MFS family permease
MAMKLVATRVLNRYGFRQVLITNAILTGLFVALCGLFRADTPVWVMAAILIVGGFFRSLQFTAVNTLAYADLGPEAMSRASSFSAMAQQLGISLGVACAALTLNLSMKLRGDTHLALADVIAGFVIIGLFAAVSALSFARLPANAGEQLRLKR